MRQTPLQNPYKFKVNIRPVKTAYFVKADDIQAMSNLVRLTCTQWGGIRNLIIPVGDELHIPSYYRDLLELHEPDWFVSFCDQSIDVNEKMQEHVLGYLRKIFPYRSITLQSGKYFETHDNTAHALHVIPIEKLRNKQLLLPKLMTGGHSLLGLALYGDIYPGQEGYYDENTTIIPKEIEFGSASFWESQFEIRSFASPLNLTSFGVNAYKVSGGWSSLFDHIDIIIVNSFEELCAYWNIRALREIVNFRQERETLRRVICLPYELLTNKDSLESLFVTIKNNLFTPGRTANLDVYFLCNGKEMIEAVKDAISELPLLQKLTEDRIKGNTLFIGPHPERHTAIQNRPLTYMFGMFGSLTMPNDYYEGVGWNLPSITMLKFGNNEIRFDPPSEFHNLHGGAVGQDFECSVWERYPKNFRVSEAIKKNGWFSRYGISTVVGVSALSQFRQFSLPTEQETLELFFTSKGYTFLASKIDQYSNALIDLLGGIQEIELLASKSTFKLLDILALKSTKKIAQRIVKELSLQDSQAPEIAKVFDELELATELKDVPRTINQLNSDPRLGLSKQNLLDIVDRLTNVQVLKRGFYLPCPNCATFEWYPLQTVSEYVSCPGCSYQFVLPARENENSESEIRWRYRLNSVVNRVMDQDALVGILAVYHLSKNKTSACHSFGVDLKRDNRTITDLDFLFVSNQELYAGECKTGTKIGEKDLNTARIAASLGITKFYFCTVSQFDSDSVKAIEALSRDIGDSDNPIEILILSGKDLLGEPL